jgi:hypothetical protein
VANRECCIITLRILIMSDAEKRKYIEEIFKYCKIDSMLVIYKTGNLLRLDCPFEVLVITDVGELYKGLVCLVDALKIEISLVDVYII